MFSTSPIPWSSARAMGAALEYFMGNTWFNIVLQQRDDSHWYNQQYLLRAFCCINCVQWGSTVRDIDLTPRPIVLCLELSPATFTAVLIRWSWLLFSRLKLNLWVFLILVYSCRDNHISRWHRSRSAAADECGTTAVPHCNTFGMGVLAWPFLLTKNAQNIVVLAEAATSWTYHHILRK